ncbi:MAG: glycerophosphodiester phosphodiesterase [Actinobacteria bacterium]|nr:glycerophosphodiester phosphodiesterase [Actinomycetota bacterium]
MNPLVIAHRGASWDHPENTLAAFHHAVAVGADYIELDVRAARGCHVVVHDAVRHALVEMRELKPDVPTLDEVLDECAGHVGFVLDLKTRGIEEEVLAAVDEHGIDADAVIIASFVPEIIRATRRLRPELRTIQHVGRVSVRRASEYAWGVGFPNLVANEARIGRARRLGLRTSVFTVNERRRMHQLTRYGVDAIFTDRPDVLRDVVAAAAA